MSDLSVTRWLHELQQGSEAAAGRLWELLHQRIQRLAKKELQHRTVTGFDEEDVALSAFDTLCRSIQQKRYEVGDRDELWRLLAVITINKARRRARDENRLRRGGGFNRQCGELLGSLASSQPDAGMAMAMEEECERLLSRLKKREVQLVALLKVEGYTNEEVAQQLGCSRRAVQRRLAIIRQLWADPGETEELIEEEAKEDAKEVV